MAAGDTNVGTTPTKLALALQTAKASPTLVMCTERRYAEEVAESIYELIDDADGSLGQRVGNLELSGLLGEDSVLPRMVLKGIAFHHAGLSQAVRDVIERMARDKELHCICSTTTLAEGVHLPFRSLVIPYLSFPGGEYMDRAMFQNIVGRAGRAYSNVRATVIVCDPGSNSAVSRHLHDEILQKYGEPIDVTSRLSRVTTRATSFSQFEDQLRLESQVIGFIGDQTMLADQSTLFADATFAAHQTKSSARVKAAVEEVLSRLETREPPIVQRNSPLSLTPFGQAASLSGISEKSVRVVRREIEQMHDDDRPWFHIEPFLRHPLSSELRDDISGLICCPFEFISNSAVAKAQFPQLLKFAKRWSDARDTGWLEETAIDRFLLSRWIGGAKAQEIANEALCLGYKRYPFNKKNETDRVSDVREYFDHNLIIFLWMLSAAIYLSESYCRERNLQAPPHRSVLPLLESGVPSRTALLLVSEGLPRHLAAKFSEPLPDTWETGEESVIIEAAQRFVRDAYESLEDSADKASALEFCNALERG